MLRPAVFLVLLVCAGGCVERRLQLESNPPGALVFLNGEEVGRTPMELPFEWYGRYEVAVRKEGFETIKDKRWLVAPWWQWPPIDLAAEILPLRLTHRPTMRFDLEPATTGDAGLLDRARLLREQANGDG